MLNKVLSNKKRFNMISDRSIQHMMLKHYIMVFLTLLPVLSTALVHASKPLLPKEELKKLATKIEAVENSITNIRFEADSWVEHGPSASGPWQKTPICHSKTAWAQKGPAGKARVDMHKEVFEWIDGPTPFGEQGYSVSFDGQHGRYVRHTAGPIGEPHPVKRGEILPEVPKRLEHGNFDTGAYYSLPFFDGEIYKFSKIFQLASDPNSEVASELEFTLEEFEGAECIKIRSRLYDVTYWLDPAHGFALRGKKSVAQYEDGHEELVKFVKVTKLIEVADGVWWPMEVYSVSRPYEEGKPWRRFVYRASNVVANDPNFDESVFTVPLPDGYLIDDKVAGKKYKVGQK